MTMASMDCDTPLILKDESEYSNSGFLFDYEDSSSGYDSTDVSDVESITSYDSTDSLVTAPSFHKYETEVMNFRSTGSLCSNLSLILEMPELCDVMFLVGPKETPIYGVRAILGTRSRVFYQLLLKHQADQSNKKKTKKQKKNSSVGISRSLSEKLVIPIYKYEPELFRMLIEFIHCGTVNITEDTVVGLYCGSHQFHLPDLQTACLDFVDRCLQHGRAETILTTASDYSQHRVIRALCDKIYKRLGRRCSTQYAEISV